MQRKRASTAQLASAAAAREIEMAGKHQTTQQGREALTRALLARGVLAELRAARESQRLSLADVAERTGMTRTAICRLETGEAPNPTLATLGRYAAALGKRLSVSLEDAPA